MVTIVIYALLLSWCTVQTLRRPGAGMAGLLCLYAITQWAQSNNWFFVTSRGLTNIITALIVLMGIARHIFSRENVFLPYPASGVAVCMLLFLAFLSILWSIDPSVSIKLWHDSIAYLIVFVLLTPLLLCSPRDARDALMMTLAISAVLLPLVLFNTQWRNREIIFVGRGRYSLGNSLQSNPLAIGQYAGYVVLISLLGNFKGLGTFWKFGRWILIPLALTVGVKSGSRGQFYNMLIAVLVFLPVSRRMNNARSFIGVLLTVAILGGITAWVLDEYGVAARWSFDRISHEYSTGRLETVKHVLAYWQQASPINFVLGTGSSTCQSTLIGTGYPHCVPIEVLVEEGPLGFALYLGIILLTIGPIRKTFRLVKDAPEHRSVLAVLGAMALYELLISVKEGSWLGNVHFPMFAILVGRYAIAVRRQVATEAAQSAAIESQFGNDEEQFDAGPPHPFPTHPFVGY